MGRGVNARLPIRNLIYTFRGGKSSMIIKILIFVVLAAIVLSLFTGLGFLVRGDQSKGMVNALTVRIVLSVLLFVLLFVAWRAGMLTPHATGN